MATISEAIALAVQKFQEGQLQEAVDICRVILATESNNADALHLLGVIGIQSGDYERAADSLQRAVAANPMDAEAFNNLGIVRKHLRQGGDALECFRRAIGLRSDFAEAHYNLANAIQESGKIDEAVDSYRRAIEFRPADAVIRCNLANALQQKGNVTEAIAEYGRAIRLQPTYAEAHYNLGNVYKKAHRDEEAVACYHRVLELNPQYAEAFSNLGAVLKDLEKFGDAAECFRRALELKPQDVELNYNWACILLAESKVSEATAVLERVLQLQPEHSEAHFNRATLRLLAGDFERGWPELEWRWKTGQQRPREFAQPMWDGQPLSGRTIFLHAEQGFGDTIQFIRYASLVKQRGGRVVIECPAALLRLVASHPDHGQLVGQGDILPPFDVHAPLLSLPAIFRTELATIPATIPYLFAEPTLVAQWEGKLSALKGFRVGVNWRGRAGRGSFRQRDIPLRRFSTLAAIPGVRLISLQKGDGGRDSNQALGDLQILNLGDQIDERSGPFTDTAAIMKNIDLVITSDTSIAHLAGALGITVWTVLPFVPEWRWLLGRSDSPWYPTMRLFRQKEPGDWESVFEEIEAALRRRVNALRS